MLICGFGTSNDYNKAKLAHLESGVDFQEQEVYPDQSPELLSR